MFAIAAVHAHLIQADWTGDAKDHMLYFSQARVLDELAMGRLAMIDGVEGILFRIGRWSEAYKMQVFYSRKTEKMLGKEHPSTLTSMGNLALILSSQGKYKEAEEMHRQALALKERVLGKEYSNKLTSMNNLASVLSSQGKYEEAEWIYRQTRALKERVVRTDEWE